MLTRFSVCSLCMTLASPGFAEIKAEDVWQNYRDVIALISDQPPGIVTRDGDMLRIKGTTQTLILPGLPGIPDLPTSVEVTWPDLNLTDQDDGTVKLSYPGGMTMRAVLEWPKDDTYTAAFHAGLPEIAAIASGQPGDVTYSYAFPVFDYQLTILGSDQSRTMNYEGSITDMHGTERVTVNDTLRFVSNYSAAQEIHSSNTTMASEEYAEDTTTRATQSEVKVTAILPRDGIDLLNLSVAFSKGLLFSVQHQSDTYSDEYNTSAGGDFQAETTFGAEQFKAELALAPIAAGVEMSAGKMSIRENSSVMEAPIEVSMRDARILVQLPHLASDLAQPFSVVMNSRGIELSDESWAMIDPGAALPRDPGLHRLSLSGTVRNGVNWLSYKEVAPLMESERVPLDLLSLNIEDYTVQGAGLRFDATGKLRFDPSDTDTYDGIPKPIGEARAALTGLNGFLQNLVTAGLIGQQEMFTARMGVGAMFKPNPDAGEDALSSDIDFTEDGQLIVNGLRLR